MTIIRLLLALSFLTGVMAGPASAALTPEQALKVSQKAIGRTVSDLTFTDMDGKTVHLSDFRGKPLVVSFVYSSCAYSCPVVMSTLADAVAVAKDAMDVDAFNVVTVGFDTSRDTPENMKSFARRFNLGAEGWRFLSGDLQTVARFTDQLGFTFYPSSKGFDHLDQVTIIDKHGVVFRQVYGSQFETQHFVDPLMDLVFGTKSPWSSPAELWKKIRLFCTLYDPRADRYRFDYSMFFQIFVGATIITYLLFFVISNAWRLWRQDRKSLTAIKDQSALPEQ